MGLLITGTGRKDTRVPLEGDGDGDEASVSAGGKPPKFGARSMEDEEVSTDQGRYRVCHSPFSTLLPLGCESKGVPIFQLQSSYHTLAHPLISYCLPALSGSVLSRTMVNGVQ